MNVLKSKFPVIRLSWRRPSLVNINIVSNYFGVFWINAISLLAIPLFIKILGTHEWGLAAACSSLAIVANLIDIGFSQMIPKWIASAAYDSTRLWAYYKFFERIYFALGLILFLLIQFFAGILAHHWFKVDHTQAKGLEVAIRIIGIQLFFQFFNNLHLGIWNGLQKQVVSNWRTCVFATAKYGLSIVAISWIPWALVYVSTCAIVAGIEAIVNRYSIIKEITSFKKVSPMLSHISYKLFFQEVFVLSTGITVGIIASQLDRIFLSKTLPISDFGIYTVIVTFSLGFLQFHSPLSRSYLPIFSKQYHESGHLSINSLKVYAIKTLIFSVIPVLIVACFAGQILLLWLHSPEIASAGLLPMRLLLIAVIINMLYSCVYTLLVSTGKTYLILGINIMSIIVAFLLAMISLTAHAGIVLGGIVWIGISLTQLCMGLFWLFSNNIMPRAPGSVVI